MAATDVKNDVSLGASLDAFWELEESSGDRVDSTVNGNDLPEFNSVTSGGGKQGTAALFTAANSEYLQIANAALTGVNGGTTVSMAGWVKFNTLGVQTRLMAKGIGGAANRSFFFSVLSTNELSVSTSSDGSSWTATNTTTTWSPTTGVWYHVGWSMNGTSLKIYVNGSQIGSTFTGSSSLYNDNAPLNLSSDGGGGFMDGFMDEWGYWSKELSATDFSNLYNGGSGIPYDAGGVVTRRIFNVS